LGNWAIERFIGDRVIGASGDSERQTRRDSAIAAAASRDGESPNDPIPHSLN
jgi:class 3 adenylate cyclase